MKFYFSLSFQMTIFFTIISMLAVIGVGSLNYIESKKIIIMQFEKSMDDIANTISNSINEKVDSAASSVLKISGDQTLFQEDDGKIQMFLSSVVKSSTLFYNIYYFSPDGPIRAMAYSDDRDLNKYHGENFMKYQKDDKTSLVYEKIIQARDTMTPVFSSFFKSATGKLMNSFIVPVINEEKVVGILSCAISLDASSRLSEVMDVLKPHPKGFVALTNQANEIVAGVGPVPKNLSKDVAKSMPEPTRRQKTGYYHVNRKIEKTGLGIITGLPESVIESLLTKLRINTFYYTIAVGLFASLSGFLVARFLVSPLSKLADGMHKLNNNEALKKINVSASGEIAQAIIAFNEIVEKQKKNKN
jgi:HAMP domain-containing protein